MASIRQIKRRIKSAKNISQVTKALQMVSAVKMRRAQEMALAGKPYASELLNMLMELSNFIDTGTHPYFRQPPVISKILVVVIATEKGLAGTLITNLMKKTLHLDRQLKANNWRQIAITPDAEIQAITWGKKARDIVRKFGWTIKADFSGKSRGLLEDEVRTLEKITTESFLRGEADMVLIVYSDFINTMTQNATTIQFLPMSPPVSETKKPSLMKFEPSPELVIDPLVRHYHKTILSQIIFDSMASEHSARMVAMKNAYDNAKDIIKYLTLTYNQTRQTSITNEIADIVSGSLISD